SLSFSNDGSLIASGSSDQTVRITRVPDGSAVAVFRGHTAGVTSTAFRPDRYEVVSTSSDGTLRIWDIEGKSPSQVLQLPSGADCVAYSPDGQLLAVGCWNGLVQVWRREPLELLRTLKAHEGFVSAVGFVRSEGLLVSAGGMDDTVKVWDIRGEKPIIIYEGNDGSGVNCTAVSPDGKLLAYGQSSGRLVVVRITSEGGSAPGDVNGDGTVSMADVTLLLRMAAGIVAATPQQVLAGDVNADGKLTTADVSLLLRRVVGLWDKRNA
ncbi:MAG: dockerin type I domain-containing protein, partial [Armatimonadota bacterium]